MRRLLLLLVLLTAAPSLATEEYAERTALDCAACHGDDRGGGSLTELGKAFAASFRGAGREARRAPVISVLRLALRFAHIAVAFLWFGTIIYVHLFLRPAYAAGGLPRGELRIGWASIPLLGITGIGLTLLKVHSWGFFTASRYGAVLLAKIACYAFLLVSAAFVTRVIGPRLKAAAKGKATDAAGATTLEGLATFDGKEGRPSRFAYRGLLYDVSTSRLWREGVHARRHRAGADLTPLLAQAPHGPEVLDRATVVGALSAEAAPTPPAVRVFHILASVNLTIVFVVLFLLALWRW